MNEARDIRPEKLKMHTLIIGEMGSCHDNDIGRAYRLIELTAEAGADICKAQYWSSADRLAERRRADVYREVYRAYQMPTAWLPLLKRRCDDAGIEFMCTAYLPEDVAVVAPYVKRFKVASFESMDKALAAAHEEFPDKEVIISLGMFDGEKWQAICDDSHRVGNVLSHLRSPSRLLHCVSSYPAPLDELNLAVFHEISWQTGQPVLAGLSDHTRHRWTGALAVAAGATILERHLRLDDTDPANPDYAVASEPALFRKYVANVRLAERMLGDGVKRAMPSEAAMMAYRVRA